MHRIHTDVPNAIIRFSLEGLVKDDEMRTFVKELEAATLNLKGKSIRILADVRAFKPASPEGAEMIRRVQLFGLQHGVTRVAEIVESETVALQLNRVAKESGTDKILRRFWDDDSANHWLLHGG